LKTWLKRTLYLTAALCLTLLFLISGGLIGYEKGFAKASASQASEFNIGKKNFCQLDENDRILVCPMSRRMILSNRGNMIVYVCDSQHKYGYVMFQNMNDSFKDRVLNGMRQRFRGMKVTQACETSAGPVYQVFPK